MKIKTIITGVVVFSLSLFTSVSIASQHGSMDTSHSGHGGMDHGTKGHTMEAHSQHAVAVGVIHRVSRLNKMVNLTHEPIPELDWPEMTMDLPVADSVDLGSIKTGEKVKFHLELGADKRYIITKIMK